MTNREIWDIALRQSAIDCNCRPEDFLGTEHIYTLSRPHPEARKYIPLALKCNMVSYGSNIVAQTSPELRATVEDYLNTYDMAHAFETPNLYALNGRLEPFGLQVCFMAEYFLPEQIVEQSCGFALRLLHPEDFQELYLPQWGNALCKERKELDVLAVGAYDGETLVGLAGCSADCETMYQIGVDVLPQYRHWGIASALVSRLALETFRLGKVPFYCAAWCNLKSVRTALKCGFRPAWVEVTARDVEFVRRMNGC